MYFLYSFLLYCLVPILFIRLWLKQFRGRSFQKKTQQGRWKERFGFISNYPFTEQAVWIHTVSVGEFIAVLPLIKLLQQQHPNIPLLITTTTMTGSDQVINHLGNSVFHSYIPWDLPDAMARFYKTVNPRLVLVMETEIWPNLLYQAKKRATPIVLINARMSEKSAKSYQRIGRFTHKVINYFSQICVQSEADSKRLLSLGVPVDKLSTTGNLKFDLVIDKSLIEKSLLIKQQLQWEKNNILLASSTHQGEDEMVLVLFNQLKQKQPELKLILVARHPERFKFIEGLARKNSTFVSRRSEINPDYQGKCDILIGDSLGEMLLYFNMASIVIMGGTFIKHGGHNILEPAALGKAIFYGSSMYNFTAINELFISNNSTIQVDEMEDLNAIISDYLDKPEQIEALGIKAKQLFDKNSGSREKIYQMIKPYLS